MRAEATSAPEDWSGSVDISSEDLPGARTFAHLNWQAELDAIDADEFMDIELPANELADSDQLDEELNLKQ